MPVHPKIIRKKSAQYVMPASFKNRFAVRSSSSLNIISKKSTALREASFSMEIVMSLISKASKKIPTAPPNKINAIKEYPIINNTIPARIKGISKRPKILPSFLKKFSLLSFFPSISCLA